MAPVSYIIIEECKTTEFQSKIIYAQQKQTVSVYREVASRMQPPMKELHNLSITAVIRECRVHLQITIRRNENCT